jgi:hypothetical protein
MKIILNKTTSAAASSLMVEKVCESIYDIYVNNMVAKTKQKEHVPRQELGIVK